MCSKARGWCGPIVLRRFLLADSVVRAPIGYEWTHKDDQDDAWAPDFAWVPAGRYGSAPASRLSVQLGPQRMVVDFTRLRAAQPAGDTDILDTLVFRPGYFQVALRPTPLQLRNGRPVWIHSRKQVERATIYHRRTDPALLLPTELGRKR
jgi:hypothetical protein